jgi:hypothetical protein
VKTQRFDKEVLIKERTMKRIGFIVLGVLMSCALAFALGGCANDETAIRNGLTTELDQFKDPNSALWKEITDSSASDFADMGVETQDLINAWTNGFSFEVGEITVDGDTAQAKISITSKQLISAMDGLTETLMNDPSVQEMTESELTKKTGELILNALEKSAPVTTEITVPCTKSGNQWSEDESATNEYARALLGSGYAGVGSAD